MPKIKITGFYRNRDDRWGGLLCAHPVSVAPGFPGQKNCIEIANQTKCIPPVAVNLPFRFAYCSFF